MSLQAHTNKPGVHSVVDAFHKSWRGADGGVWNGVTYFRTKHSSKSSPSYPPWTRNGSTVIFKQPSAYLRVIDIRTNPTVSGVEYKANGAIKGWYVDYASDRTGNSPVLGHMPRVMANNSDSPFEDSNAIRRAEVECLLKFREDGVSLGNALAEAKSTVDMFSQNAATLAKALLAMKRGDLKGAYRALGGGSGFSRWASSNYLQWKFGWAPLMSDIRDGVETLKKQLQLDDKIVKNVRNIQQDNRWSYDVGSNVSLRPNKLEGQGSHTTTVVLWAKFKPDAWRQAAEAYGLDDPLGILWEVTPWSFVVDWVVPVGNLLSALSVRERLDFVGGYNSTRAQGENRIQVPVAHYPRTESPTMASVKRFGFKRNPYSAMPFPMPYVKSPFSTSHTTTAAALLRQLLR